MFSESVNLLNPTGHVMHQQFNIQQLYALPQLFMCFVLSENKKGLVPLTPQTVRFFITEMKCLLRGTDWVLK